MWEKYRAPPPILNPPALRGKAPADKLGRSVDDHGALVVKRPTAVAVADVGNAARLYLTVSTAAVLMNRWTAALIVLCVVYHLFDLTWRKWAAGCIGCFGDERMRTGSNSACNNGRERRTLIRLETFLKACLHRGQYL